MWWGGNWGVNTVKLPLLGTGDCSHLLGSPKPPGWTNLPQTEWHWPFKTPPGVSQLKLNMETWKATRYCHNCIVLNILITVSNSSSFCFQLVSETTVVKASFLAHWVDSSFPYLQKCLGTSLLVQLRFRAPNAGGPGLIPGEGNGSILA